MSSATGALHFARVAGNLDKIQLKYDTGWIRPNEEPLCCDMPFNQQQESWIYKPNYLSAYV